MNLQRMPVSELAAVRAGGGAPQDPNAFTASGFPFIRAGSLPKLLRGLSEDTLERIEPDAAKKHGLTLFPEGTVVFAKSGMSATKGHVYRLRRAAYVVNHLAALVPHDPDDSEFLVRVLQRFSPTALIKDPAYPSIRLGDIEQMTVIAPTDPKDRRRIAGVLDGADALCAKRRSALAQVQRLTQSIFFEMFGDPGRNPKAWAKSPLGDLISAGPQNGLYKPASDYGSGTPILRIDAFYDGVVTGLASLKRVRISDNERGLYALTEGEIVVNRVNSREYLGKSAIIPYLDESIVFESNMMRFDVDRKRLDPFFLIHFLQTQCVREQILRSAKDAVNQSSINQQDIKALSILLPPLSLQQRFVQRSKLVDHIRAAHDKSLGASETLFRSLQHRAFRGEL